MLTLDKPTKIALGIAAAVVIATGAYWIGRSPAPRVEEGVSVDVQKDGSQQTQAQSIGHWQLEEQFEGPLKDTVVQRWRDPATNAICYIYLPVIVQHAPPLQNGMVHYASNAIGTISCLPPKS